MRAFLTLLLAGACACGLPDATAQGAGDRTATAAPSFTIALPMRLDGRYLGDVATTIAGEKILLPVERVRTLLSQSLTEEAAASLDTVAIDGKLEIGAFSLDGVDFTFDTAMQQIEVTSSNSTRDEQTLYLGFQDNRIQADPADPANISLFVTPRVTLQYGWDDNLGVDQKGFGDVTGIVDIGGRLFGESGFAFISRHSFQSGDRGGFNRDETQLIYDRNDWLTRFTVGDVRPRGTGFQGIPSIGGISVERFFDLDPTRVFRPVGRSSFELERQSTVEVRINGVVQQELFLRPGRYNIRDLPLVQGSNLVDLVIRDDTGREIVISDRDFFDFDLLGVGTTDFSVTAGVRSRFTEDGLEYTDDPIITAFARRGITQSLTMGADLQADNRGGNGGISALWASPLGVWRTEAAYSDFEDLGSGYAGELGYRATGRFGDTTQWRWNFDASAQYFSDNFSTVDSGALSGPVISDTPVIATPISAPVTGPGLTLGGVQPVEALFNMGAQLNRQRLSLNLAGTYTKARTGGRDTSNVIAGFTYALRPRLSVGAFGRYFDDGQDEDWGATLQLAWRIGRSRNLSASYDTARNQADARYRRFAPPTVGALSYGVNALYDGENDAFNLGGDAFYTANRFQASLRHDVVGSPDINGNSSEVGQISRATIGTSVVMADGQFGIGRPVRDTFLIVSPHKTLRDSDLRLDPTERGYSSKTDFLGPAVDVDQVAYARQSTYIDVPNLPVGYDLGTGQITTKAPLFAGYSIEVGSGASRTIIGRVFNADGTPAQYVGGEMTSLDDTSAEAVPAFTNRNGRLAATGLQPGAYELTLFTQGEPYTMRVDVPEEGEPLLDIGEITLP